MEKGDESPTRRHKMSSRLGIILVLSIIADTASCDEKNKYPIQVHQMFQERTKFGFKGDQRVKGSWGSWAPWSECSRSCGTGVQSQSRECIPYREYSQRKRSIASVEEPRLPSKPYCIGNYMRYHVCNTQDCTDAGDLRTEQCAAYDAKLYKGQSYQWEPFLDAPNECALNCRAIGERFYATLQRAVLDGTPCRGPSRPARTPGVLAPGATANRWLCVAGQCKAVGCDGVIGSQRLLDACGVCGGEGNSCRLFEGIFLEPKLPKGYHLVTTIPKGAVSLNISEVRPAGTILALKDFNGSYFLNGVQMRSPSGYYKGVGTTFVYRHGNRAAAEQIWSEGPLMKPVDLMILAENLNPGILYKYQLPLRDGMEERAMIAPPVLVAAEPNDRFDNEIPEDTNHLTSIPPSTIEWNNKSGSQRRKNSRIPSLTKMAGDQPMQSEMRKDGKRRRKGKKFMWTIAGSTPCSKACGGGVQRATFKCFRINTQAVAPDRRCKGIPRPASPPPLRCNTRPCPARWRAGAWSECSVTCGRGVQTRVLECVQELNDKLTMRVADGACIETSTLKTSAPCEQPACKAPAGGQPVSRPGIPSGAESGGAPTWSTGSWGPCSSTCGRATRKRRVTCITAGTTCSPATKPTEESTCDLPSCEGMPQLRAPWLYTEWSEQCSVECGLGFKTRQVACADGNEVFCDVGKKPTKIESCTSNNTSCSQTRYEWFVGMWSACTVTCGTGMRRREIVCLAKGSEGFVVSADARCSAERPISEETCTAAACPAEWFKSDWSECSKTCGSGIQERAVRCLREGVPTSGCSELSEPTGRRLCNTESCKMKRPLTPGSVKETGVKADCVDLYRSCDLVLKAKLCRINYYKRSCCKCRDR